MFLWLPWLFLWSILIRSLLSLHAKCCSGHFGSSCGRFLFCPHQVLMQNAPLAALAIPVVVSYATLNKT